MTDVKIEKKGGFAGFGGPGSRLKSRGRFSISELSAADQAAVTGLFAGKKSPRDQAPAADMHTYVLTRETAKGTETVEAPESAVPEAVRDRVKDELE